MRVKRGRRERTRGGAAGPRIAPVLGLCLLCAVACGTTARESRQPDAHGPTQDPAHAERAVLEALEHLRGGDAATAGEMLAEVSDGKGTPELSEKAGFYSLIACLMQMEDAAALATCRDLAREYVEGHPRSPYEKSASRILELLDAQLERQRRQAGEIGRMRRRLGEQAQTIERLEYQIKKLEEIQQETERQRELLELDGPGRRPPSDEPPDGLPAPGEGAEGNGERSGG